MILPRCFIAALGLSTSALADTPIGCNLDNCLRAMIREGGVTAAPFCQQFTANVNTNVAALPTYASMCSPNPISRISSACSCFVADSAGPTSTSPFTNTTFTSFNSSSFSSSSSLSSSNYSPTTITLTATAAQTPDCHEDNCLRAMIREGGTGATPFCWEFTTAIVTNTAALPTYASMCSPNPVLGISSACSCFVTQTASLPALKAANVTPAPGCSEDNCLRAMIREGNAGATPFCNQFTTAVVTNPAALPTYASMCTPNAIAGISSACSCI